MLTGGEQHGDKGYYIQPTVFYDVDPYSELATTEIFGPVLAILKPFKDLDEVLKLERESNPFGLAAGIFTNKLSAIRQFTRNDSGRNCLG